MRVNASTGPTPGHRGQQLIPPREIGIGGDHLGQAFVEEMDIGLEPRQATLAEAPQHGILKMGGLVLDCDMLVAELAPHGDDLGEPLGGGGHAAQRVSA